jgi:glycine/D-amino acid oxidase-like deaminating enzyme
LFALKQLNKAVTRFGRYRVIGVKITVISKCKMDHHCVLGSHRVPQVYLSSLPNKKLTVEVAHMHMANSSSPTTNNRCRLGENDYDLIIIGAGMVGSAAARHALAMRPGSKILLLGPAEHEDKNESAATRGSNNDTASNNERNEWHPSEAHCHGDEGRITRRLDPDRVWATVAARSIDRYASLEEQSGVTFHTPCGFVACGDRGGTYASRVRSNAAGLGLLSKRADDADTTGRAVSMAYANDEDGPHCVVAADQVKELNGNELAARFPALHFPGLGAVHLDSLQAFVEAGKTAGGTTGAGLISARKLVRAQQLLFVKQGGILNRDTAEEVRALPPSSSQPSASAVVSADGDAASVGWQGVVTSSGSLLRARRLLVATNSATNLRPLLPRRLALTLYTQTTARLNLSDS